MLLTRHYDQRPFNETVCDAIIANGGVKDRQKGVKPLRWRMHQTWFRFSLCVRCRAYGSVQLTVCDDEEQKKRAARWRCVRYTTYGSLGWTVCDQATQWKWFNWTRCVWYVANRSVIRNVCGRVTVAGCLKFIPISCMGPKHATKDTDFIFQPVYMHWSTCM